MRNALLALSMIACTGAMAQLPDGSVCPNFTGTDLDGNTHTLYDYLDQGYTVVLDVFATWCPPCWSYHNSGALDELYTQHGPGTSDNRIMVMAIEADASTSVADLYGTGGNTTGNWVANTPYPIINDASIGNLLQIAYYPTVYTVCPSRIIHQSGQLDYAAHWANATTPDCAAAITGSNLTMLSYNSSRAVCGDIDMEVSIANMGTVTATSATVVVKEAGSVIATQNWSGSLATYANTTVSFPAVTITNPTAVTIEITTSDLDPSDNTLNPGLEAAASAPSTQITVEIMTDNYGAETYWRIMNGAGAMVIEGGNVLVGTTNNGVNAPASPTAYGSNTVYTTTVSAPANDCYTFEIYDYYGDGICCAYGTGYYKVRSTYGNVEFLSGAEFGENENRAFLTAFDDVSVAELDGSVRNIYPNPTTGLVNLDINSSNNNVTIDVVNILGERVISQNLLNGLRTIDMSEMSNGMYFFNITDGATRTTQKVTLDR